MSGRRGELALAQQLDVGAIVVALRADGMCWKRLEEHFGSSRRQLWRYARRYLATQPADVASRALQAA